MGVWELPGLYRPLLPPSPHSFLGATLEDLRPKARSKLLHSLPSPTSWDPLRAPPAMLCPTALTPTPTMTIVQFVQRRATCPKPQSGVTPAGTGEARPIPTQICLDTFSSVPSEWSKTPETGAPHTGSVALTRTPPHPKPTSTRTPRPLDRPRLGPAPPLQQATGRQGPFPWQGGNKRQDMGSNPNALLFIQTRVKLVSGDALKPCTQEVG